MIGERLFGSVNPGRKMWNLRRRRKIMDESLYKTVTGILIEKFLIDPNRITPDVSLVFDLEFDSLDEVQLTRALEKAFEIEIGSAELANLDTISEVVGLVSEKRAVVK
jgi:acyl carrier protein